jgi:hypothetical protein
MVAGTPSPAGLRFHVNIEVRRTFCDVCSYRGIAGEFAMSEKPPLAKGKPPVESPTKIDQEAATIGPDEALEIAHIAGKVIRKDPGAAGATQALPQETVDMPLREQQSEPAVARAAPVTEKAATILGDYRLLQKLGQGGMGAVFKAHQISRDRVVAVKVLSKELAGKEANIKRFEREAKVMLKLDHPNILRCFDVDQARGYHFLTMEFIEASKTGSESSASSPSATPCTSFSRRRPLLNTLTRKRQFTATSSRTTFS